MAFKLNIKTDNAAFGEEGYERNEEIGRILREIAGKVLDGHNQGKAIDYNGNTVGEWTITEE